MTRSSCTALNSIALPSHARPPVLPLHGPATRSNFQAIASSSPRRYAGDVQPRADHGTDHGDIERAPVVVAPGDVGRMVPRRLDAGQHLAGGIVDVDAARAGAIDVALNVTLHTVGNATLGADVLIKQPPLAEYAVGPDVVDADEALATAVHVQQLFVR